MTRLSSNYYLAAMLKPRATSPGDADFIFWALVTVPFILFTPFTPFGRPLSFEDSLGRPLACAAIVTDDLSVLSNVVLIFGLEDDTKLPGSVARGSGQ